MKILDEISKAYEEFMASPDSRADNNFDYFGEGYLAAQEKLAARCTADEFAAMARDAERYRWFRNKLRDYDGDVALWEHCKGCDYEIKQGANLDAAIDAAMAERNK